MGFKLKLKTRGVEVQQDYCEKCHQFGHTHRNCGLGITCYKCGKVGHHGRDCTEDIYVESVAIQSAKEQGQLGTEFYGDKRQATGNEGIENWDERAAADREAEDPGNRLTEADYELREKRKYDLVLTPEEQAVKARKEAKRRKNEEKARQREEDKKLIEKYRKKEKEKEIKVETPMPPPPMPSMPPPLPAAKRPTLMEMPPPPPSIKVICEMCKAVVKGVDSKFCANCGGRVGGSIGVDEKQAAKEAYAKEEVRRREEAKKSTTEQFDKKLKYKMRKQKDYFQPPTWASPRDDKRLYISVQKNGAQLETWDVSEHPYYLIGKNTEIVDFPMEHPSVSRVHLAVIHDASRRATYVQDLKSQWGTKLNSKKLTPNEPTLLELNSQVKVGGSSRVVVLKERSRWE